MDVVEMAVMEIICMISMLYGGVTAIGAVLVVVIWVRVTSV